MTGNSRDLPRATGRRKRAAQGGAETPMPPAGRPVVRQRYAMRNEQKPACRGRFQQPWPRTPPVQEQRAVAGCQPNVRPCFGSAEATS